MTSQKPLLNLSNLEVRKIVEELNETVGERVKKIQLVSEREYKLRLEKSTVIISPPEAVYLTGRKYPAKRPDNFSMYTRKRLEGKRIKEVTQHDFDRVITIHFEGDYRLVIELFAEGNMILIDPEGMTRKALKYDEWKDRKVKKKVEYNYPTPKGENPFRITEKEFLKETKGKKPLKAALKLLNMSKKYVKEILHTSDVQREELTEETSKKLFKKLKKTVSREKEPGIQDGPVLFPLETLDKGFEEKESFSEAVDDYITEKRKSKKERRKEEKLSKLKHRLEQQKKAKQKFRDQIKKYKEKGDWIYNHLNELKEMFMKEDFDKEIDGFKARKEGKKLILEE